MHRNNSHRTSGLLKSRQRSELLACLINMIEIVSYIYHFLVFGLP